jgi:hypothetical protein
MTRRITATPPSPHGATGPQAAWMLARRPIAEGGERARMRVGDGGSVAMRKRISNETKGISWHSC